MNTKRLFFLVMLAFLAIVKTASAQLPEVTLSENAKISLLTCSGGEELYSIFGHSAIRVHDPEYGIDWVFNYGVFDFNDPDFYPKFVRGKLNYILAVSSYKNFEIGYIFEERSIYEQVLNLSLNEKQMLLDSLSINYLPENRYYLYDFLFDNCATRIRNILVETTPRPLNFDYSTFDEGLSFRELLMPNLVDMPWAGLGINLLLGVSADRTAHPWEYMFLPEHLMAAFENVSVANDSILAPLSQSPSVLLEGKTLSGSSLRQAPLMVFILLLLLSFYVTYVNLRKSKLNYWFDRFLFGIAGLLGVVLAFQWFGSDHTVMANNFNLIWAHPLHLVAAITMSLKGMKKIVRIYFGINSILMVLLMLFWVIIPQTLPFPMFPVVAAMAVRSAVIFRFNR
ncbi:MAG: DUF4105 domain-containing protein [Tenuifilaceae bacterium]|nr:DUF4105 domain-containing protein [Tenuifilaceae bacterium]